MAHRIVIIGTTGTGKTTLARRIAQKSGIAHIELDALNWEANWTQTSPDIFRARVETALQPDEWVIDGNYGKVRDITWGRATMIVWLDYPFLINFWQLFRRTMVRLLTRESLWGHSHETWRSQFFTKDSLFLWFLKTYGRHRREIPILLAQPDYRHLLSIHLRHASETEHWFSEFV